MNRDPDSNPNLPPWLRGQSLPPRPATDAITPLPEPSDSAPVANETVPDWLRDTASPTTAGAQSIPDWLQASTGSTATGDETLPDWLQASAGEPPQSTGGETLPDWLRESEPRAETASTTPNQETLPDWLRESEPRAENVVTAPNQETLPGWLRGLNAEDAADKQPTVPMQSAATGGVPDWLLAMADQEPDPPASAEATPDWLREQVTPQADSTLDWLREPDQPALVPPSTSFEAPVVPQLPNLDSPTISMPTIGDWLGDISPDQIRAAMEPDEEPLVATPFSFDNDDTTPRSVAPSGPPTWFGDATPETTSNWFDPPAAESAAVLPRDLNDDDAPAWLKDASEREPSFDAAPQPADNGPLWLLDEPLAPSEDTPVGESTMPSWLQNAAPPSESPPDVGTAAPAWLSAEQSDAPAPAAPSAPDWLGAAEPAPVDQAPPSSDIPDWLREVAPVPVLPTEGADLPTWLQSEKTVAPTPSISAGSLADPNLPPWLRDEGGVALPTASAPGEQDLPPWLKGAAVGEVTPPAVEAPMLQLPDSPAPATSSWFDDATSDTDQSSDASENEFLGSTDLPAWLRRPQEQKAVANTADSRALDWLTRLGSPEEELAAPVAPTRYAPPPNPAKSPAQVQAIALLQQLATDTAPQSAPLIVAEPRSFWRRAFAERLLYLLLLAALLIGPFVPTLTAPLAVPPTVPGAQTLYTQISSLGPSNVVLIGYEWDARRVAELRPMESAVIDELIARKVKLVLMSTDPQGSLLLYDLRERLNRAGYQPGGQDYILLGYQPGGEFALRALAQNFGQVLRSDFQGADMSVSPLASGKATGSNKPLASLNDLSMIMLLADEPVDVQGWMEQVYQAAPRVPFAALMTAEAAPAADPYLRQPNVYGLSGTSGALAFAALRGGDTRELTATTSQLRLGMALFVMLLLLAGLIAAIVDATRRRRA